MEKVNKKVILTGGGTAGPVAPLLGVVDELRKEGKKYEYLWLGTKKGVEKRMVEGDNIRFIPILGGKLRRYFSFLNFFDFFRIVIAFGQAFYIILKEKPSIVLSAGAYVSVPVAWAAWFHGVPLLIHQQDARPGLANKLMAPFARIVTVALEKSLADYGKKGQLVGNSVRQEFRDFKISPRQAKQLLGLSSKLPVVLILGGGTGAKSINDMVEIATSELTKFCQLLHISGQGKMTGKMTDLQESNPNYKVREFMDASGITKAFAAADVVVSRAGMSTLTELSFLGKPAIIIPIPNSHQEENARVFEEEEAAIVLRQESLKPSELVDSIKNLIINDGWRQQLSLNIQTVIKEGGTEAIAAIINELLEENN